MSATKTMLVVSVAPLSDIYTSSEGVGGDGHTLR